MNNLQKYNNIRNNLNAFSNFVVGGKLDKKASKEELIQGVANLVSTYDLLKLNVFDGKLEPIEFNVESTIRFVDGGVDVVDALEDAHNTYFKSGVQHPLWGVIVVDQQWILLLFEHTLYDGNTGAFFLEDLLSLLNKDPVDSKQSAAVQEDLTKPSYSTIVDSLLSHYLPSVSRLKKKWFSATSPYEGDAGDLWKLDKPKDISSMSTFRTLVSLDKAQFINIKTHLKKHNVGFTSLLIYLNVYIISKIANGTLKVEIPVNLRRFIDNARQKGLFVSGIYLFLQNIKDNNEEEEIDWSYVQYINSQFSNENLRRSAENIGMLDYVDIADYLHKTIAGPRTTTYEISNLGIRRSSSSDSGEFKFTEFIFSQPNNHTGAYFMNNVISSDQYVSILFEGAPDTEDVFTKYVDDVKRLIYKLGDT